MNPKERLREHLPEITPDYLDRRAAEGWRVAHIEWERGSGEAAALRWTEEVPYGLRVSADCKRLEENPDETAVLIALMEEIVRDRRISEAAVELNRRGYRSREGRAWTPGALFDMLPRLIEVGPRIFRSDEWAIRRRALVRAVTPTVVG